MRRLKRFAQLTDTERRILVRVLFVVGMARTALFVLSTDTARRWQPTPPLAPRIARADGVGGTVASRYLPGATCLTQALAAQALLTQSGFPSQVEIGVARDDRRRLQAHAWVVCHGQVVLGGQQPNHYNSIIVLD